MKQNELASENASSTSGGTPIAHRGNERLRVFLIGYIYPPEVQSMGVMLQELAEDLARAGHDVTVVTGWPNHPAGVLFPGWKKQFCRVEDTPEGFRLVRCLHAICGIRKITSRLWYYLSFALSSYLNSMNLGPADVVVSMSTPIFGTWAARSLAKAKRAAFVYEIDDLLPEAARNAGMMKEGMVYRTLRRLDTSLCRKSNAIVTLSNEMKSHIAARKVDEDKVHVVPFWIDTDKIVPRDRVNAWRRNQGISETAFVALYAGTIGLISGSEVLIDAAKQLKDRPEILFLIVGEGVGRDRLQERAVQEGLTNMRFLPFQPADVLADVFATADVGLVTLLPEAGKTSIPSKVLGYLAAGRGVVASVLSDCGLADLIRAGDCGRVVPCQDSTAIAQAIAQLADDREGCRDMGRRGRSYVEREYGRSRCTKTYESLLVAKRDEYLGLPPGFRSRGKAGGQFTVVPLAERHLPSAVDIHMRAFPGFFLTFMGPAFLRELYRSFITQPQGVGFVAQASNGRVLGLAVGPVQASSYYSTLFRQRWWAFGLRSIAPMTRRPGVMLHLLRTFRRHGDSPVGVERALLSSIFVAPEAQGLGVGQALLAAWTQHVRQRGCTGCYLTTDAENNDATNRFYKSSGWTLESTFETKDHRKMNRYILDFEPTQPASPS